MKMNEKELKLRYDDATFWYNVNMYIFIISLSVWFFICSNYDINDQH